ncbi:MAG: DNA recombination protein RmuC [Alistipes sp.]|nr:DNA recombination protein RmuC [Alistipes sp.]
MEGTLLILVIAVVALVLGAVCGYLFSRMRTAASEALLAQSRLELERTKAELGRSRESHALLQAENARLLEQLRQQDEERRNLRAESERAFREIATSIFDEKSKVMRESNTLQLGEILTPFKVDLENLKKTIHDCYTGEVSEVKSLRDSIKDLADLNHTIGREAKELSRALRGNSKVRGDWGELFLRQLLEKSGLEEGVNFTIQATKNEDGTQIKSSAGGQLRPDALFHLPDGRCIVVDAKVALPAYTTYVSASVEDQPAALKEHIAAVKRHIDDLASKEYHRNVKDAADFVLMFIPNEGAYLTAMGADKGLWEYAYDKQIVVVSPTHLISVLKLMYQLWIRDKQTKNALKIAEDTGKLYDKFVGFVEDMENVGKSLRSAQQSYEGAYNKLSSGKGNLITKVEQIRKLGVKTDKQLKVEEEA